MGPPSIGVRQGYLGPFADEDHSSQSKPVATQTSGGAAGEIISLALLHYPGTARALRELNLASHDMLRPSLRGGRLLAGGV